MVPPWRPGRPNQPACIGRPDNATSEVASEPVAIHPMRSCLKESSPGNTTYNSIQFSASERARLSEGRRRKTLAAHVTTERERVVTWAPHSTAINSVALRRQVPSGVVPPEPCHQAAIAVDFRAQDRSQCTRRLISGRVLAIKAPGIRAKSPPIRIEFSVTPVFRVRIVDPLDAATAEKWQGIPHLAFANGVGRVR